MEFMLSETLPIYSGGLGNVAGDQFQGPSDLGLRRMASASLSAGYFRQVIAGGYYKEGREKST